MQRLLDIKDKTVFEIISPIIGIHFDPLIMLLTGTFGGFVSGFLGTGCGIIITPLLISLGLPPFVAVSTQLCHAIGTNFISFLVYKRKTDVDFMLAFYILVGGSIGAFFEWLFLRHATNPQVIMQKFLYVYIAVLSIFGFLTLRRSFSARQSINRNTVTKYNIIMRKWMKYLPVHKVFARSRTEMSVLIPILLGIATGMLVASLGGGSNLFMAPILTYLIGRISPVVYGTVSMASFVITVFVTFVYAFQAYCCDIVIVLLLFAGASFGSWCGIKLTYKVPRYYISTISGLLMLCLASKQIYKIFNSSQYYDIQQISVPAFIALHPIMYTSLCIFSITVIAYFHERILEKLSKTRWFRK